MTTFKQQLIANHLTEYLEIRQQDAISFAKNTEFDHSLWTQFFNKSKPLSDATEQYFHSKTSIPNDIVLSFHDGFFKNIQANNDNTFNVSILTHQYQKIDNDNTPSPSSYQEIEPIYLNFTIDNSFRNIFRKLTQMKDILHLVYDGENLGLIILNKKNKPQPIVIDSLDLSNLSVTPIENKVKKLKP